MSAARAIATLSALVTGSALLAEFVLTTRSTLADGGTVGGAIWHLLSYFTILTNLSVFTVAVATVREPHGPFARPQVVMAVMVAIVLVGILFFALLFDPEKLTDAQLAVTIGLHGLSPPLFVLVWLALPHGRLAWKDARWAGLAPALYGVYSLTRGLADGFFPYWFLNPLQQSLVSFGRNVVVLLVVFVLVGALVVALDKAIAAVRTRAAPT